MSNYVGRTFGNYQLLRFLGRGGFAEVYLGRHRYIDTIAAIKVLHGIGPETHEAFQREARVIAHLQHPHIVRIHEFGIEDDQTPYLVMEYSPHGSLRAVHPKGSRLSFELIVSYVKQLALALDYAHEQNVVHRDIKPENILMNARDEILLSDFGIAVIQNTMASQSTQNQAGTPLYMAPEQIQQHPCAASDQYALAVMIYEWLCGETPFRGSLFEVLSQHLYKEPPSLCARIPQLPPAIENTIFTALAKDPLRRFPSVQVFADTLEEISFDTLVSPQLPLDFERKPVPQMPSSPSPLVDVLPTSLTDRPLTFFTNAPQTPEPIPFTLKQTMLNSRTQTFTRLRTPQSSRLRSRWKLVSLLVVILFIISGLASFFLLKSTSLPYVYQNIHGSSSPQTSQKTDGTPSSGGISVPQKVSGTPGSAVPVQKNANSTPSAQNLYDTTTKQAADLTLYSQGWVNGGRCIFDAVNGSYNVSIVPGQQPDSPNYYSTYCWNQAALYHNFLYQVDVNTARGSCTGLLFRLNRSSLQGSLYVGAQPTGYYMGICPNWSRTQGGTCQFLIYSHSPIAENNQDCGGITGNGGGTDTIAVLAQNNRLSFFLNKKLVFSYEDTKYQTGYLALLASCSNAPVGTAGTLLKQGKFTNLNVWAIAE